MKSLGQREWRPGDAAIAFVVAAFAALLMLPNWGAPTYWEPDGLFYEAQKMEVQGESRDRALAKVFSGPLANDMRERENDEPPHLRAYSDPEWIEYSSDFYRRRWAVPVVAAAVDPLFGVDSLKTISLLGYVAVAALLYLLLRRRFSTLVSLAVTLPCLLLPPLRYVAADPGTDSWGLALLIAGLLAAMLALERDRRWLIAWAAVAVLLAFTRDLTIVLIAAAAWVALRERSRTAIALVAIALAAALPPPLLTGAPMRETLAYVNNGFRVPADSSWGHVLADYPDQLLRLLGDDLAYPFTFRFPLPVLLAMALFFAGCLTLLALRRSGDRYFSLMQGALAGGVLTILVSAHFTVWRLELAMLPAAAVGVAVLLERVERRFRPRMEAGDFQPETLVSAPFAGRE